MMITAALVLEDRKDYLVSKAHVIAGHWGKIRCHFSSRGRAY